ncbi:TPA: hypothetical protein N0F65_005307 [Lagenidium giganteum]|uniref:E3 ubiquitin-protein ligase Zswim2 n=1 Tax=Lagenidium giganteum TaxID=4803 RepID=A0AAV2YZ30_9STRA|nr:TPA: hypothetical protein N0F65_005307 [Lagenidium giganteum]
MSRLVPFRSKVPENVKQKMEQTMATTMYLVQTSGPTSYVVQDQNCEKKHKVLIGALQTCSCGDGDVCVHILFVMLKVLRVPATTPVVWQKSLIDSEIEMLLRGDYCEKSRPRPQANAFLRKSKKGAATPDEADVERHDLTAGEVCAICQEEMDPTQPLTFCRKGCGNNFHIECMKVFGESRRQSKENIICPLCRHNWGETALTELKKASDDANRAPNVHKKVSCKKCQTKPIRNARYRCLQCKNVDLCDRCFKMNVHLNHAFVMKTLVSDPWMPALRSTQRRAPLSAETMRDLEQRELSTEDYETLLQLDGGDKYPLQEYLLAQLQGQKVSAQQAKSFGEAGASCVLCRQSLRIQADVRSLLCGHIFHESCLSRSILSHVYCCPYPSCTFVLFPGLHQLTLSKASNAEGGSAHVTSDEARGPASSMVLPPLDSSFCVVSYQHAHPPPTQDVTGKSSRATKRPGPRIKATKTKKDPEISAAGSPALELLSVALAPAVRQPGAQRSDHSRGEHTRAAPPGNQEEHERDRTLPAMPATPPDRSSTASSTNTRGSTAVSLPPLQSKRPGSSLQPMDDPLMSRMHHAQQVRQELRQADKDHLRKQRLQREERVKQHLSNQQSSNQALDGLVTMTVSHRTDSGPLGAGLDGKLTRAHEYRTTKQQKFVEDRAAKRRERDEQREQQRHLLPLDPVQLGLVIGPRK